MKQIFILDNTEMNSLREGIALQLALPGGAVILLQAENPVKKRGNYKTNGVVELPRSGTTTEKIREYLINNPDSKASNIMKDLGVSRSTITCCLYANSRGLFKSTGSNRNRTWRAK